MSTKPLKVIDVKEYETRMVSDLPMDVLHWLREHTVADLKHLLLEMHSDGEDITDYAMVEEELEHLERQWKLLGYLPAREEDTNPLEYVDEEIKDAIHV